VIAKIATASATLRWDVLAAISKERS